MKDLDGKVTVPEVSQLTPTVVAIFDPLNAEVTGLLSYDDIHDLYAHDGQQLTRQELLVLEHIWADRLAQAITNANGKVVTNRLLHATYLVEGQLRFVRDRPVIVSFHRYESFDVCAL